MRYTVSYFNLHLCDKQIGLFQMNTRKLLYALPQFTRVYSFENRNELELAKLIELISIIYTHTKLIFTLNWFTPVNIDFRLYIYTS